jgi:hypothetical protein
LGHHLLLSCEEPYRSDLKPARTSSEKSFGCSQAAKCLPLGSWLNARPDEKGLPKFSSLRPAELPPKSNSGEMRLKVLDPQGAPVAVAVRLHSLANPYDPVFQTDDAGELVAKRLPYGIYEIRREAFAPATETETETAEIRSALQASKSIQLQIAAVSSVRSLLRPHCFAEFAAVACGSPK